MSDDSEEFVLRVENLKKYFPLRKGFLETMLSREEATVKAVDGISFNVRNTQKWHDYLVSQGVECLGPPERSPRGHTFFFAKDFDGNLIEIMDLGYMYHVLKWLGPLGGWLFRRGMYKQYYETKNKN